MPTTTDNHRVAVDSEYAPLYAAAGLADVAFETVRLTVAAGLDQVRTRQAELEERARARRSRAEVSAAEILRYAGDLPTQVRALPDQLRGLPELAKSQWVEAQNQATGYYADLAGRGKGKVDTTLLAARKATAGFASRAAGAADDVVADVADAADQARTASAATRATAARRSGGASTAAKRGATRTAAAKKAPAKKAPAKKAPAKKSPSKKTASSR